MDNTDVGDGYGGDDSNGDGEVGDERALFVGRFRIDLEDGDVPGPCPTTPDIHKANLLFTHVAQRYPQLSEGQYPAVDPQSSLPAIPIWLGPSVSEPRRRWLTSDPGRPSMWILEVHAALIERSVDRCFVRHSGKRDE